MNQSGNMLLQELESYFINNKAMSMVLKYSVYYCKTQRHTKQENWSDEDWFL